MVLEILKMIILFYLIYEKGAVCMIPNTRIEYFL